jgi:HK97 family phage portal protein
MNLIQRLLCWWRRKSAVAALPSSSAGPMLDVFRRVRPPTATELLGELKNTAYTCASINASVCAAFPPKLYVATAPGESVRWPTRVVDGATERRLIRETAERGSLSQQKSSVLEITEHPLLTLLCSVNPVHNAFDLWEFTQLSLEIHGTAYWLLDLDPVLGTPAQIWVLPAHLVTPRREATSANLVDYYEYRGNVTERFAPERVIVFRCPDPRDPYASGLSPLRACFEQVMLTSEFAALKRCLYDNAGLPSVVLTGSDAMGEDERNRLERMWQQKFSRGGHGQALVTETSVKVTPLSQSLGDLAALADMKAAKEDIANAFGVPLPLLSGETNLANMQAADHLHKTLAIWPRLKRRDQKLNEQLVPRFDASGRLFLASDDPTPANQEFALRQEASDLRLGVRTINEVRSSRGLSPVAWGDKPLEKLQIAN